LAADALLRLRVVDHAGGGLRLPFSFGSLQRRTKKRRRGGGAQEGQRGGARVFERIRGGQKIRRRGSRWWLAWPWGKRWSTLLACLCEEDVRKRSR
jgi:hypothetical protein